MPKALKPKAKARSRQPVARGPWWQIHALGPRAEGEGAAAEILIYGDIGEDFFGESIPAREFVEALSEIEADHIDVRINSFGGSVADGLAIHNALRRHPGTVDTHIDGVAYSIASLIAMAGETVHMASNALFMVHAPWTIAFGNSNDFRTTADELDKHAQAMASAYARKLGEGGHDDALALLTDGADHYFTADEAAEAGFVDAITDALAAAAHATRQSYRELRGVAAAAPARRSGFSPTATPEPTNSVGLKSDLRPSTPTTAAAAADPTPDEVIAMNWKTMAALLGIDTANMAEDAIAAAVRAKLNLQDSATLDDAQTAVAARAAAPVPQAPDEGAVRAQVQAAETRRRNDIRTAFAAFRARDGVADLETACVDDMDCTVEAARTQLLAHLGSTAAPAQQHPRIEAGADEGEQFRAGVVASLAARMGVAADDTANNFRGYTALELCRASLERRGVSTSAMSKREVVGAALTHTSSDFPVILENLASKSMLQGVEEAEESFPQYTATGSLPDFKEAGRVDLSAYPTLPQVGEGGEYTFATLGERGEKAALAKFGSRVMLTREMLINDDLGAFGRLLRKQGRAAIRTVGNLVVLQFADPAAVMSDGQPVFIADAGDDRGNLVTGAAPSTAAVESMRVQLRRQQDVIRDKDGNVIERVESPVPLNILLAPTGVDGELRVVMESQVDVGASTRNNTVPNKVRGIASVIEEHRLNGFSATAYYGMANPQVHDALEVLYLDGNSAPFLESREGFSVDGIEWKVRIEAAAKLWDRRSIVKNPGA